MLIRRHEPQPAARWCASAASATIARPHQPLDVRPAGIEGPAWKISSRTFDFRASSQFRSNGANVRFNREARERFLRFATSGRPSGAATSATSMAPSCAWPPHPRRPHHHELVDEEIARLRREWHPHDAPHHDLLLRCLGEKDSRPSTPSTMTVEASAARGRRGG